MTQYKHVAHYAANRTMEPIDVIADWHLNFNLGNAVKYISRAGRKADVDIDIGYAKIDDLNKAIAYLEHEIDVTEKWLERPVDGSKQ